MNSAKASDTKSAGQQQRGTNAVSAAPQPLALGQRLGNQGLGQLLSARRLQAKLAVSNPNDVYEQEADRVADQVMRMADPQHRSLSNTPVSVQRKCKSCEEKLYRSPESSDAPSVDAATERSIGSLSGRGNPLPQSVRAFMEPRFGADFSAVRVHNDAHAHGLARAVNAHAFAVGRNVVFGAGHYAPETENGKRLLAHELTHVVQQTGSGAVAIARKPSNAEHARESAAAQERATWLELHEGVFAYLTPTATTIDNVARYLSGYPQMPTVLAQLNHVSRQTLIHQAHPLIVPIELIDRDEAFQDMPDDVGRRIDARLSELAQMERKQRYGKVSGGHSAGPGVVGLIPLTTEALKQAGAGLSYFGERALHVIAFVAGVVHGFLKSIWDALSGLAKLLYNVVKSLVTQELISDIKQLVDDVRQLSWQKIADKLGAWAEGWATKLESKDPWTAGHAHGYLTGHVMGQAVMTLLSGGALAAAKAALLSTEIGKLIARSRVWVALQSRVVKVRNSAREAGDAVSDALEALRESRVGKVVKVAEVVGTAGLWTVTTVMKALDLPSAIARTVAEKLVAHAKQLSIFFPRIRVLSDRAKRWLFGCNSPCDWDPDDLVKTLEGHSNAQIEDRSRPPKAPRRSKQLRDLRRLRNRLRRGIDPKLAAPAVQVANPVRGGTVSRGMFRGRKAYAAYNEALARSQGREVGLYWNEGTGEYAVRVGEQGVVRPPWGEHGWHAVVHYHPGADSILRLRLPSVGDFEDLAWLYVGRGKQHVFEFVEFDIPNVGRGRAEFGYDPAHPDKPVYVRIHKPNEPAQTLRFESTEDFAAYWGQRTIHTAPGEALYDDLVEQARVLFGDLNLQVPKQRGDHAGADASREGGERTVLLADDWAFDELSHNAVRRARRAMSDARRDSARVGYRDPKPAGPDYKDPEATLGNCGSASKHAARALVGVGVPGKDIYMNQVGDIPGFAGLGKHTFVVYTRLPDRVDILIDPSFAQFTGDRNRTVEALLARAPGGAQLRSDLIGQGYTVLTDDIAKLYVRAVCEGREVPAVRAADLKADRANLGKNPARIDPFRC
jgi:hypothetical protein